MGNEHFWSALHRTHKHTPSNTEPLLSQAGGQNDTDIFYKNKSTSQLFYSMFTPIKLDARLTSNQVIPASLSIH